MIVSFYVDGEKVSHEIATEHYLEIQKKIASSQEIDIESYPYDKVVLEQIIAYKGSNKKAKSDIEYESCDYDTQM